ncbi:hypothetical protein RJT34_19708 [Clitoria ternatea]|uniref:Uncharacterized protein n=1 Tax=Clitoria ternatea TaxID=43366 RepID=A0AAN9IRP2_CLITE
MSWHLGLQILKPIVGTIAGQRDKKKRKLTSKKKTDERENRGERERSAKARKSEASDVEVMVDAETDVCELG